MFIPHKSPTDSDIPIPYLKKSEDGFLRLNRNHKYCTHCQHRIRVSGNKKYYFFCLYIQWKLFGGASFRPELLVKSENQYFLANSL